jgi:hypothetical protein
MCFEVKLLAQGILGADTLLQDEVENPMHGRDVTNRYFPRGEIDSLAKLF